MSLLDLPSGVLVSIAELYLSPSSLRNLHATNKRLSILLAPALHSLAVTNTHAPTALYYAATASNEPLLRYILTNATNLTIRASAAGKPLHDGMKGPTFTEDLVTLLLSPEHRNKLVITDSKLHATPLHWAAKHGNVTITKRLLAMGVSVNTTEKNGGVALGWAAYNGNTEVIKALLDGGADFMMKDRMGQRPLHYAIAKGKKDAVDMLKEAREKQKEEEQMRERRGEKKVKRNQRLRAAQMPAITVVADSI